VSFFFGGSACRWWLGSLSLLNPPFGLYYFYFNFFISLFVKVLFVFNFIFQSKFIVYYFYQFDPHSFDFFSSFVKTILFSISLFNQEFIFIFISILIFIFLIFFLDPFAKLILLFNFALQSNIQFILYFSFDPHCFICCFSFLFFFLNSFV